MQNFIFIKVGKKNIKVSYDEIVYIEALSNYVRIITIKDTYLVLEKLKHLESALSPHYFCRIHRSYIIAFKHTIAFDNNLVYLESNITLPISKYYKTILEERVSRKSKVLKAKVDDSQKN